MKIHTSYLDDILSYNKFNILVTSVAAKIKKEAPTAQAIAFRGCSGCLIGMAVCTKLELPPLLVRKDGSHSWMKVEGALDVTKYVIVDDFVDTGDTIAAIKSQVKLAQPKRKRQSMLGVFCYARAKDSRTQKINGSNVRIHYCGMGPESGWTSTRGASNLSISQGFNGLIKRNNTIH